MRNLLLFILMSVVTNCAAQNLRKEKSYFKRQKVEYQAWLNSTGISQAISIKRIDIEKDKVILSLIGNNKNNDLFNKTWKTLEQNFLEKNNYPLSNKMIDIFHFLLELDEGEGEIRIFDNRFKSLMLKVQYIDNEIVASDYFPEIMSGGTINITLNDLNFTKTTNNSEFNNDTLSDINSRIGNFLQDYFSPFGSKFYSARIDTSKTYRHSLVYIVTCLSEHVLSDNYYEKIRIEIDVFKKKEEIEIAYDITGKYASGWLCPKKREAFYKSMEVKYPDELEQFAKHLSKLIEEDIIKSILDK